MLLFMKIHVYLPSTFIHVLRYVKSKMIVHASISLNLINRTIEVQEKLKIVKNLYTKSAESRSLMASQILAEF